MRAGALSAGASHVIGSPYAHSPSLLLDPRDRRTKKNRLTHSNSYKMANQRVVCSSQPGSFLCPVIWALKGLGWSVCAGLSVCPEEAPSLGSVYLSGCVEGIPLPECFKLMKHFIQLDTLLMLPSCLKGGSLDLCAM